MLLLLYTHKKIPFHASGNVPFDLLNWRFTASKMSSWSHLVWTLRERYLIFLWTSSEIFMAPTKEVEIAKIAERSWCVYNGPIPWRFKIYAKYFRICRNENVGKKDERVQLEIKKREREIKENDYVVISLIYLWCLVIKNCKGFCLKLLRTCTTYKEDVGIWRLMSQFLYLIKLLFRLGRKEIQVIARILSISPDKDEFILAKRTVF